MATFADMVTDLHILTMGRLSDDLLKLFLNRAQSQECENYDWSFLHTNYVLNTVPQRTEGTITVSRGSNLVSGTGAAFSQADVGAFLWIGGLNIPPVPIQSVQGANTVTLQFAWSGPTVVNTGYVVAPLYYLIEGSLEIKSIRQQVDLVKVTQEDLNGIDPMRIAQGGDPSLNWAPAPASPDGSLQVELWPVPSQYAPYLVSYKMRAPVMVYDNDTPVIPYQCLEYLALNACFMALYSSTGSAANADLAQKYNDLYTASHEEAQVADRRRLAAKNQVTAGTPQQGWVWLRELGTTDFGSIGGGAGGS